jgi:hypothetical protein
MKNIAILLLAAVVGMTSCRKETTLTYHATANIYFDLDAVGKRDSLLYTFAYHPEVLQDTVWVPVRISGDRDSTTDRKFVVKVIDTLTTAVVNKHYETLSRDYTMKAGYGLTYIPVIVYNTDTNMVKRSFTVTIQVQPTDDFNTNIRQLTTTRVVVSNRLEKPVWWDTWVKGRYSQVKHQLFRLAATTEELSMESLQAPKNLYYVDKLKALLTSPSTWIKNNPDKGYELKPRPDGNFDFYPIATPYKSIPYVKFNATGQFYFIDETGKEVI